MYNKVGGSCRSANRPGHVGRLQVSIGSDYFESASTTSPIPISANEQIF